jgi:hypothetical protein
MSVRRSRKRKREESDEVLDTTVEDKNDETVTPATPEPNGEGTFAETEEKEMQDKDQLVWEAFREEYIECKHITARSFTYICSLNEM